MEVVDIDAPGNNIDNENILMKRLQGWSIRGTQHRRSERKWGDRMFKKVINPN